LIALLSALQSENYRTAERLKLCGERKNSGKTEPGDGSADTGLQTEKWAGRTFRIGCLKGTPVVTGWTGTGTTPAGISCQYICSRWRPEAVLFAGIGGALNPAYRTGEVVAAQEVLQWDLSAEALGIHAGIFPGEYTSEGKALGGLEPDPVLLALVKKVSPFPVRQGRFLSGNSFVPPESAALKGFSGDMVDMESIGVALAAYYNSIPCLILRIVGDTAEGRPKNFRTFMDDASGKIADIFEAVLTEYKGNGSA